MTTRSCRTEDGKISPGGDLKLPSMTDLPVQEARRRAASAGLCAVTLPAERPPHCTGAPGSGW